MIEEIEQRVNCLEAIFSDSTISQKLGADSRAKIKSFLEHAFLTATASKMGRSSRTKVFETLNAELKVMMGDEAFTRSLKSRYELANSALISLKAISLEPNGVRLSGVLGYEMYNLYLSVHYYQSVLDRFLFADRHLCTIVSSDANGLPYGSIDQ
ncbi:MAG: hypothetical protein H6728_01560 [Myxococcales bacterium]|nr:hypothetical protein [Myxococcales bacterium]